MSNIITLLQTLSIRNLIVILTDLIYNRILENRFFRVMETYSAVNTRLMFDQSNKRSFLFGLTFILITYKWLKLFKRLILWPFKLGIYSFFYSILGFDINWFLG